MATLQELERPIDEEIANSLIQAIPEHWKSAMLEVIRSQKPNQVEGFAHVISSPEGHRDIVQPTEDLLNATLKLADLFAQFGNPWTKVTYLVEQKPDGNWKYSADFVY